MTALMFGSVLRVCCRLQAAKLEEDFADTVGILLDLLQAYKVHTLQLFLVVILGPAGWSGCVQTSVDILDNCAGGSTEWLYARVNVQA